MDGICKCCHGLFRKFLGESMKKGIFVFSMRLIVCFLNICPVYVTNYEMNEWMPNEMDRRIYKFLLNWCCGFAVVSYWTASLKKPRQMP